MRRRGVGEAYSSSSVVSGKDCPLAAIRYILTIGVRQDEVRASTITLPTKNLFTFSIDIIGPLWFSHNL